MEFDHLAARAELNGFHIQLLGETALIISLHLINEANEVRVSVCEDHARGMPLQFRFAICPWSCYPFLWQVFFYDYLPHKAIFVFVIVNVLLTNVSTRGQSPNENTPNITLEIPRENWDPSLIIPDPTVLVAKFI
jgi:hypothetical protein